MPPLLPCCLLFANFDSEGGESCMEQEVALTMMGHEEESAPCSSSSLSISWRFIAIASAANDVRSLALLFLCRIIGVGSVFTGALPCTHGCCKTCAALSLFLASRNSNLEMRSLAPEDMGAQSLSGNSYFPS